jgi:hypothetical protein
VPLCPAGMLSPKVLLVAPHQRLSRQYHYCLAKVWPFLLGTVGVITSPNLEGKLLPGV